MPASDNFNAPLLWLYIMNLKSFPVAKIITAIRDWFIHSGPMAITMSRVQKMPRQLTKDNYTFFWCLTKVVHTKTAQQSILALNNTIMIHTKVEYISLCCIGLMWLRWVRFIIDSFINLDQDLLKNVQNFWIRWGHSLSLDISIMDEGKLPLLSFTQNLG